MKCTDLITYGPGGDCTKEAKWWVQDGPKRPWVPRCGHHAKLPPFTARKRVPITEPRPEWMGRADAAAREVLHEAAPLATTFKPHK